MRRLLLILAVALVMAAMLVANAAPAFATHNLGHCPKGQELVGGVCVGVGAL